MRPRSDFNSDLDYQNHLDHELNAARGRGDKRTEEDVVKAMTKLHGHAGAEKRPVGRPRKNTGVETRS